MTTKTAVAPKKRAQRKTTKRAAAAKPRDPRRELLQDFAWAVGLAALILLIIILRDPHGRSFIYAVF